ncbi:hypothetical protein HDU97_005422 [Phlyctochytrium planicorne]|nr:hypothetical protein HDU97_005422 [Phlyctochytrium planicorne]
MKQHQYSLVIAPIIRLWPLIAYPLLVFLVSRLSLELRGTDPKSYFWLSNGFIVGLLVRSPKRTRPFLPLLCLMTVFAAMRALENNVTAVLLAMLNMIESVLVAVVVIVMEFRMGKLMGRDFDDNDGGLGWQPVALYGALSLSSATVFGLVRTISRQLFSNQYQLVIDRDFGTALLMDATADLFALVAICPVVLTTTKTELVKLLKLGEQPKQLLFLGLVVVAIGVPQLFAFTFGYYGGLITFYASIFPIIYVSSRMGSRIFSALNTLVVLSCLMTLRWQSRIRPDSQNVRNQWLQQHVEDISTNHHVELDLIKQNLRQESQQSADRLQCIQQLVSKVRACLKWVEPFVKARDKWPLGQHEFTVASYLYCCACEVHNFFDEEYFLEASMKRSKVNLPSFIQRSVAFAGKLFEKHHVRFGYSIGENIPAFAYVDRGKMRQCIFNLILNAFQNSSLDLTQLRGLFTPFAKPESFKRRSVGLGFGLALTEKIAKSLGGRVWAVSQGGNGSTFAFCVPVLTGEVERNALADPADDDEMFPALLELAFTSVADMYNRVIREPEMPRPPALQLSSGKINAYGSRSGSAKFESLTRLEQKPPILHNSHVIAVSNEKDNCFAIPETIDMAYVEGGKTSKDVAIDVFDEDDKVWAGTNSAHVPEKSERIESAFNFTPVTTQEQVKLPAVKDIDPSIDICSSSSTKSKVSNPPPTSASKRTTLPDDGAHILITENSSISRQILSKMLKCVVPDLKIHEASDFGEAIDNCQNYDYNLILIDPQIQKSNGEALIPQIRLHGILSPVIAITSHLVTPEAEEMLTQAGFADVISKPLSKEVVSKLVSSYLMAKADGSDRMFSLPKPDQPSLIDKLQLPATSGTAKRRSWTDDGAPTIIASKATSTDNAFGDLKVYQILREESASRKISESTVSKDGGTMSRRGTLLRESNQKHEIRLDPVFTNGPVPCVLVVDDSSICRTVLVRMLEKTGLTFDISEAANGSEAMKLCTLRKYNLIFMDLEMPGMDGVETSARIRFLGHQTPIVVVTGNTFRADAQSSLKQAGINDFVMKPISRQKILELIRTYLPHMSGGSAAPPLVDPTMSASSSGDMSPDLRRHSIDMMSMKDPGQLFGHRRLRSESMSQKVYGESSHARKLSFNSGEKKRNKTTAKTFHTSPLSEFKIMDTLKTKETLK